MNGLNNSVIVCDTPPKSSKKKKPLGSKKPAQSVKKTYYESPLKHIQLSSKRWKTLQSQRKAKHSSCPRTESRLQESVIVLSDNESATSDHNEKDAVVRVKTSNMCTSVKRKGEPISGNKRKRKKKISSPSNKNASCMIISDTDESDGDAGLVNKDEENLAPSERLASNHGSDDVIMVWSSKNVDCQSNDKEKNEKQKQETERKETIERLFMIDFSPNPLNLSCLEDGAETAANAAQLPFGEKKKEDIEENILPFSKKGLVLPPVDLNRATPISTKPPLLIDTTTHTDRILLASDYACLQRTGESANKEHNGLNFGKPGSGSGLPVVHYNQGDTSRQSERTALAGSKTVHATEEHAPGSTGLREIIIDGNNIAMAHSNNKTFSEIGLKIVIDYFKQRGHAVKAFVPQYRRALCHTMLESLHKQGIVVFTPSRKVAGRRITPYDDRFILEYATLCKGIVVSLDQYRDLYMEKPEWRDTIENRLLAPTFVGNYVMFPEDPLGRNGPRLDDFLKY